MSQPRGVSKKPTISQQPDKRDWIPIIVGAIAALLGGGVFLRLFSTLLFPMLMHQMYRFSLSQMVNVMEIMLGF